MQRKFQFERKLINSSIIQKFIPTQTYKSTYDELNIYELLLLILFCISFGFFGCLIKLYTFSLNKTITTTLIDNESIETQLDIHLNYWKYFRIDFIINVLLVTIFLNTLTDYTEICCIISIILTLLLIISMNKKSLKVSNESSDKTIEDKSYFNFELLNGKMVKYAVYIFRTSAYVQTFVAILSVDFKTFRIYMLKRNTFGIGYMDVGIGMFVFCHSLRLIRNSNNVIKIKKEPILK
jgi:hypothetical protein